MVFLPRGFDRGTEGLQLPVWRAWRFISVSRYSRSHTRVNGQLDHVMHRETLHALKKKKWCNTVRQLRGSCGLRKLPSETFESPAVDTLLKRPSPAECHILWPIHKLRGAATTKGLATRVEKRRRVRSHVVFFPRVYYYPSRGAVTIVVAPVFQNGVPSWPEWGHVPQGECTRCHRARALCLSPHYGR